MQQRAGSKSPPRRPAAQRIAGALWVALVAVPSCDDHIVGEGIPFTTTCLRRPPLDYDNFGDGIIGRQCRPCHSALQREAQRGGAPEGVDFDNEQDVLDWASEIHVWAIELEAMPPAGGMLALERDLLGEWLRCDVLPRVGLIDAEPGETP